MSISSAMNPAASGRGEKTRTITVCDVSRAYCYAVATRFVFDRIADEDFEPGDEN